MPQGGTQPEGEGGTGEGQEGTRGREYPTGYEKEVRLPSGDAFADPLAVRRANPWQSIVSRYYPFGTGTRDSHS